MTEADAVSGRHSLRPIQHQTIVLAVGLIWLAFIAINAVETALGLSREARILLLDVNEERSLYTWFSGLLLAGAGGLLLRTWWDSAAWPAWLRSQWLILGGVFMFLSADEMLAFHERLTEPVRAALNTGRVFAFAWMIPYGVVSLVGLLAAVPFLRSLPPLTRNRFVIAAAIYLAGAIGCEMIGAAIAESHGGVEALTVANGLTAFNTEAVLEEGLEGLGLLVFVAALLDFRSRTFGEPASRQGV